VVQADRMKRADHGLCDDAFAAGSLLDKAGNDSCGGAEL